MSRPGVEVTSRATRTVSGDPTDSGTWFVVDFAEQGPSDEAVEITSLDDFEDIFGSRVNYSMLYDSLETFFSEGGGTAFVAREVGPTPVKASKTLVDRAGSPLSTLRVDALYSGDYANGATGGLSVQVQDGTTASTFRLLIFFDGDQVESHDNMVMEPTDSTDYAPTRLATSDYVRGVDLASATSGANANPAVAAEANLTAGTDDHAAATQTEFDEALALFARELGPGQVSAPGRSTQALHQALITHASLQNRTAYLDSADQSSKSTLLAAAAAITDLVGAEYAGLFGSWFTVPGVVPSTTRSVPGSAFAAGVTNRVDGLEGTTGAPPAGQAGLAEFALDVRLPSGGLTLDDYEDLNSAGVNMARSFRNRGVQLYGFRSVTSSPDWTQLTNNRLRVSLVAKCEAAAQQFVFRTIDSKGHLLAEFNGALTGICLGEFNAGALFGDPADPDDPAGAFEVITAGINTPATAADGDLLAEINARFSQFAELVRIAITKVPLTAAL